MMRLWQWWYGAVLLLLGLSATGCVVDRGPIYVKNGRHYGATSGTVWRDTWWQNYERGLSYAEGEFWDAAVDSFQRALATSLGRQEQHRANTYGLHFLERYFPHRELGIAYYRLGRYEDALQELSTSLAHVDSAKAKFYVNKVRQALLQQSAADTRPPRILLSEPPDGLVTNQFSLMVSGQVEDDTYAAAVAVNGEPLFIELAAARLPFHTEVALQDGANSIEIVATDLLGHRTSQRLTVYLDRHGPLLSLEGVEVFGTPPHQQVRLQGVMFDHSRIARFLLAGQPIVWSGDMPWRFRHELSVPAGAVSLPFTVEDEAGNVTQGDIALMTTTNGPPKTQRGNVFPAGLPRWAALSQDTVLSDLGPWPAAPLHLAQNRDVDPPQISFSGLENREVVYADRIYMGGTVTDVSMITDFFIDRKPYLQQKCKQLFFHYVSKLQEGQNGFVLEATDEWHNRMERAIHVVYQKQPPLQFLARLRVLLLPFARTGYSNSLSETASASLSQALGEQKRFNVMTRALPELQPESLELAGVARLGKANSTEAVLLGTVVIGEARQSWDVYVRLVDVDTETVLVEENVYGENLTTPEEVKILMAGLAVKLQRHFPLVEGTVIDTDEKQLLIAMPNPRQMQTAMKLIVFRKGRLAAILGEARITLISDETLQAELLLDPVAGEIRKGDFVLPK